MSVRKAEAPFAGLRLLTASEILAAPDLEREVVPTPEWGEGTAVLVQAMDGKRRLAYRDFILTSDPRTGDRELKPDVATDAAFAALSIIDEQGEPLFTLVQVEDLAGKNPEVIDRIVRVGLRLSKMRVEDIEEAKARLKATTNGASHSGSQVTSA